MTRRRTRGTTDAATLLEPTGDTITVDRLDKVEAPVQYNLLAPARRP